MVDMLRWTARVLAILTIMFIGFIVIANIVGDREEVPGNVSTIVPMATIFLGMIIAWKWEAMGGGLTLIGYLSFGFLNPLILLAPTYVLCAVAALLFLISWYLSRKRNPAAQQCD